MLLICGRRMRPGLCGLARPLVWVPRLPVEGKVVGVRAAWARDSTLTSNRLSWGVSPLMRRVRQSAVLGGVPRR
jgi:hypothetical protein